jgi:hypothetical protein
VAAAGEILQYVMLIKLIEKKLRRASWHEYGWECGNIVP